MRKRGITGTVSIPKPTSPIANPTRQGVMDKTVPAYIACQYINQVIPTQGYDDQGFQLIRRRDVVDYLVAAGNGRGGSIELAERLKGLRP